MSTQSILVLAAAALVALIIYARRRNRSKKAEADKKAFGAWCNRRTDDKWSVFAAQDAASLAFISHAVGIRPQVISIRANGPVHDVVGDITLDCCPWKEFAHGDVPEDAIDLTMFAQDFLHWKRYGGVDEGFPGRVIEHMLQKAARSWAVELLDMRLYRGKKNGSDANARPPVELDTSCIFTDAQRRFERLLMELDRILKTHEEGIRELAMELHVSPIEAWFTENNGRPHGYISRQLDEQALEAFFKTYTPAEPPAPTATA